MRNLNNIDKQTGCYLTTGKSNLSLNFVDVNSPSYVRTECIRKIPITRIEGRLFTSTESHVLAFTSWTSSGFQPAKSEAFFSASSKNFSRKALMRSPLKQGIYP